MLKSVLKKCLIGCLVFASLYLLPVSAKSYTIGNKNIEICDYFADGAVYQANKPVGIWGTADDGTVITAQLFQGSTIVAETSTTASDGKWELELAGQKGGYTAYTIKLSVDGTEIAECSDILFGEVWLAAGQSNMQLRLFDTLDGVESLKKADNPYLRIYQANYLSELGGTLSAPAMDIEGRWIQGDKSHVGAVSAVAYYFALGLQEELDVPVAVLETSLGSTPIEAWLSKEMVDTDAELRAKLEGLGIYKTEAVTYTDMGAMYYGKVAPLSHAGIAGVIWYQGESNAKRASIYAREMDLLKEKWGEAFGFENDSMPFVFTQLAPYSFSTSYDQMLLTEMMDQMTSFYKDHESTTAMITNYDLSLQYKDTLPDSVRAVIHPTVKKPIGERMTIAAMGLVYGKKEATAPILSTCEFRDGVAVLTFSHVGDGLKLCEESLGVLGFALGNESGAWVNASAEIINHNTVFVYSNLMQNPCYVSYAYCDMNTDANLCAGNGIPAAPFSTGGNSGLGTRNYLNCDEDIFVVTGFETMGKEVGQGEYQSLWNYTERSKTSFDNKHRAQGTASVKVEYKEGTGSAVAGIDLWEASKYSVTSGLKGIKSLSVKMSNGDRREKSIRLCIKSSDGSVAFSEEQVLSAKADFDTIVFDLTNLYLDSGVNVPYPEKVSSSMVGLSIYIDDTKAGTVWIDDIKLGVDDYWEPDFQALLDNLGIKKETMEVEDGFKINRSIIIGSCVLFVLIIGACVTIGRLKKLKRKDKQF